MPRPKLFEDTETTITVADLREGDFLVSFAAQNGIRGYRVNSGVTALSADPSYWGRRAGYRSRIVIPVDSTRFTTLTGCDLVLPNAHQVIVRRKLVPASV